MKNIKRILQILMVVIILIFIAGFIFVRHISRKALPDYTKDINLAGLNANVEVYRDKYAIPHVYAKTENDLYTAVGYLMAEDRLWQMDLLRRVTLGRISEIFGKKYIDADILLRSLRYSDKSKMLLESLDSNIVRALESFSNGVNQYVETHVKNLPPEFTILGYKPEPWQPIHSLNLIGYMAWDLKAGWSEFILEDIRKVVDSVHFAEILPNVSIYKTFVYPKFDSVMKSGSFGSDMMSIMSPLNDLGIEIFNGSNNWAVSGKKSITGMPILANDMHLGLNIPGIWYQMHQVVKGKVDVTGLVLPGQPLIICGHNDKIAWGMTNTYVDNLDFYQEKINPEDSNQYWYIDGWKNFEIRTEKFATSEGDTIIKNLRFSFRGPIVSEIKKVPDKIITMHWVGDEFSNEMQTVYLLNRAGNWKEFKDALRTFRSISQNVVYADKEGNIGLFCAAGIPIRKRDAVYRILPGWTDEYNWKGMVPFEELPYSYNPECGYVSSANNKTVDDSYPYHISNWYEVPYRINRIRQLLTQKDKLSVNDFKAIQLDQKSKMAEQMLPVLLNSLESFNDLTSLQMEGLNLLKNWDGDMNKNSQAAAIFETFYNNLRQDIFADELGKELFDKLNGASSIIRPAIYRIIEEKGSVWVDDITTVKTETLADICVKSYQEAINELEQKLGSAPTDWNWGKLHQITLKHYLGSKDILDRVFSLNRGPYKVGGSFHTVSPYSYSMANPKEVNHGSSHRHIYSLNNWDSSYTIIPTGNSGIPASKNYCDQTEMYIKGEYHRDLFDSIAVISNAIYHMSFKPIK